MAHAKDGGNEVIRVHSKNGAYIAILPESLQGEFAVCVTANGVARFKASWPCSILGDKPVRFEFLGNGDLLDLTTRRDGPDVLALSQDAQEFGEACIKRRRKAEVTK
jgi:hypothetical protein